MTAHETDLDHAAPDVSGWPLIERLSRDVRATASSLSIDEATWLVRTYYDMQDIRTGSANRSRSVVNSSVQDWLSSQFSVLEGQMQGVLGRWAFAQPAGEWLSGIHGIGPVLAAGLLATFKPKKPTVGAWWRFAGLDPTVTWGKGEKRPYNAFAKVLCWKCGDSFVKFHNSPKCVYGHLYAHRKAIEVERNEAGLFAETAAGVVASGRIKDPATLAVYKDGRLPPGRLDLRARRWAVKLFLSHLHEICYIAATGEKPPKPYAIDIGGHAHYIPPGECLPECAKH